MVLFIAPVYTVPGLHYMFAQDIIIFNYDGFTKFHNYDFFNLTLN
jgi:hypothetical protein